MEQDEDFYHDKYGWCYYACAPDTTPIIFNLYVEPEYRRMGHGRRLLQVVIDILRNKGYLGNIEIEVEPREDSIDPAKLSQFYTRMGLTVINPQ